MTTEREPLKLPLIRKPIPGERFDQPIREWIEAVNAEIEKFNAREPK